MGTTLIRNVLKPNQQRWLMMAIFLSIASTVFFASRAVADFATPFRETTTKVGDVSEEGGYVVALGHEVADCNDYLVIVRNDNMQYVTIEATADKKVVKESLLGRPVIIKAQVTAREKDSNGMLVVLKLKILSVRDSKQE